MKTLFLSLVLGFGVVGFLGTPATAEARHHGWGYNSYYPSWGNSWRRASHWRGNNYNWRRGSHYYSPGWGSYGYNPSYYGSYYYSPGYYPYGGYSYPGYNSNFFLPSMPPY